MHRLCDDQVSGIICWCATLQMLGVLLGNTGISQKHFGSGGQGRVKGGGKVIISILDLHGWPDASGS